MTIQVNGRTHVIAARPGVDGMAEFQSAVRRKMGLPDNIQIVFAVSCSLPHCASARSLDMQTLDCTRHVRSSLGALFRRFMMQRLSDQGVLLSLIHI